MKVMDSIYRILRYLKLEPKKGLLYTKHNNMNVMVFIGADWHTVRMTEDPLLATAHLSEVILLNGIVKSNMWIDQVLRLNIELWAYG